MESWNFSPHRSETKGISERTKERQPYCCKQDGMKNDALILWNVIGVSDRAVRRVKEGTSAVLLQSGLDEKL